MKFEYVQKIVDRIKKDIFCPRCEKTCTKASIEVCGIEGNTIDFQTDCPECKARIHIAAELNVTSTLPSKNRPRVLVQNVNDMKNTLRTFQGEVKDLFE